MSGSRHSAQHGSLEPLTTADQGKLPCPPYPFQLSVLANEKQETTRDIVLLTKGSSSSNSAYFDSSDEKIKEISKLLESRVERERLEGMKRIIAGISKGRDMEPFFAQVVKNVVASSIEIRKLVYIYLLRL